MNECRQRPRDVISLIAAIVPPIWIVFRLATGGWSTAMFYLLIFTAVAAFYWLVVMKHEPHIHADPVSDDVLSPTTREESQPTKNSPIVIAAVAGAYVLFLILVGVAGYFVPN